MQQRGKIYSQSEYRSVVFASFGDADNNEEQKERGHERQSTLKIVKSRWLM